MENVTWKDKRTNEEVLDAVGEERSLLNTIRRRKKIWVGHILRTPGLMRDVIEGRFEGKRPRGRKRTGMLNDVRGNILYVDLKRRAENRDEWKN